MAWNMKSRLTREQFERLTPEQRDSLTDADAWHYIPRDTMLLATYDYWRNDGCKPAEAVDRIHSLLYKPTDAVPPDSGGGR